VVHVVACRILVPSEFVGAIIGKKGQTIRNITSDSNVSRYGSVHSLMLEILVLFTLCLCCARPATAVIEQ